MDICPKCDNKNVEKYFVTGHSVEMGQKYCDVCVEKRDNESFFKKLKDKILGKNN